MEFSIVRADGSITATCPVCGEKATRPDKGLGRASLAAWKTRHQHQADVRERALTELAPEDGYRPEDF